MAPPGCPSAGGGEVSPRVLYRPEPALSVAVDLKVPRARGGTPKQLGASLTLSAHRVLHHLFSWPDWLWSPSGSQPPDWRPPHGSYRTPGAGQTPARPPAALLAAWCRRPPLAPPPPPPRLPAARVPGVPLSRCTAVLLQGGPGLGPTAFFSRDCSHFGQSLPVLQHRQVPKAGGRLSGLRDAESSQSPVPSPACAPPARGADTQRNEDHSIPAGCRARARRLASADPVASRRQVPCLQGAQASRERAGCLHCLNGTD